MPSTGGGSLRTTALSQLNKKKVLHRKSPDFALIRLRTADRLLSAQSIWLPVLRSRAVESGISEGFGNWDSCERISA